MKECPVCHAMAFNDAKKCYGCLYEFGEEEVPAPEVRPATILENVPPSFLINIKPERERSGQTIWTCTVNLVPA